MALQHATRALPVIHMTNKSFLAEAEAEALLCQVGVH